MQSRRSMALNKRTAMPAAFIERRRHFVDIADIATDFYAADDMRFSGHDELSCCREGMLDAAAPICHHTTNDMPRHAWHTYDSFRWQL